MDKDNTLHLRISSEIKEWLERKAKRRGVSVSRIVSDILDFFRDMETKGG